MMELITTNLDVGFLQRKEKHILLRNLNLTLSEGKLIALLGPNGIGKSTLIKTFSGNLPALNGKVELAGKNIQSINSLERSKSLAVVHPGQTRWGWFDVKTIVSMARYGSTNSWGALNKADLEILNKSLKQAGIEHLANRIGDELSDGEKQKVVMARALAQDTPFMLLDEPTAHLDLINRFEITFLLKKLSAEMNKGILFSSHDVQVALEVADEIWLIDRDQKLHCEQPGTDSLIQKLEIIFNSEHLNINFKNGKISFLQNV